MVQSCRLPYFLTGEEESKLSSVLEEKMDAPSPVVVQLCEQGSGRLKETL